MPATDTLIYHFTTAEEWRASRAAGIHRAPSLQSEGFLHCSFREQLAATAARHFRGRDGLCLLEIEVARLQPELRCEDTSGHGVFPHLYGALNVEAVVRALPFAVDAAGSVEWTEVFASKETGC